MAKNITFKPGDKVILWENQHGYLLNGGQKVKFKARIGTHGIVYSSFMYNENLVIDVKVKSDDLEWESEKLPFETITIQCGRYDLVKA